MTGTRAARRGRATPYLLVAAAVGYLALFAGVPIVRGVQLSFTNTQLIAPRGGRQVGLDNYAHILGADAFAQTVLTTVVYAFCTVAGSLVLGTAAALILHRWFPGRTLARTVSVLPWAVPTVAVALVFRWIFNNDNGLANDGLAVLGIGARGWLTDPRYGMASVLIATIWKVTPFVMLVVLAALQSVPDELYEATRIDGADAHTAFTLVVLPYLKPTLSVVGLLMTIWSFRRFEIIWLLTGGGPVQATNTVVISVYQQAFNNSQLGFAAALGVLGLVLSLIVTLVYFVLETRSARKVDAS
jgi:multiple sugar transport system permease protein